MSVRFENLYQLLACYFHQDFVEDYGTPEEALAEMLRKASVEQRRGGAEEIAQLLNAGLCENQLRDVLLYELGCEYALESDGWEASSWLSHVRSRLLLSSGEKGTDTSGV